MENLRIAFSHGTSLISRIIRWFTRSNVNHCLFLVSERGQDYVIGADWDGLRMQSRKHFEKDGSTIAVAPLLMSLDDHLPELLEKLTTPYDYTGLIGMIPVEAARFWFRKRIHNPFHQAGALFCSEVGVKFLQLSGYPESSKLDASATDPGFLQGWLLDVYQRFHK